MTLKDVYKRFKEGPDGIYAVFYDHLHMDAHRMVVVKDHEFVELPDEVKKALKIKKEHVTDIDVLMSDDCEYYGTIGCDHTVSILKDYFNLPFYYANKTYHIFSDEWFDAREDSSYVTNNKAILYDVC